MSHDTLSRSVFGVSYETLIRRIVRTYDRASKSDVESGARWYDEAGQLAASLAVHVDGSLERSAAVISALSPRTAWSRNVAGAVAIMTSGPTAARRLGCISTNVDRATACKRDGYAGLGNGPKTHAFARNIAGDREAVTVDVWACRVVDVDETKLGASPRGETSTAYEVLADAYRAAARRRGVDPATMQATTWIVARNGRSA